MHKLKPISRDSIPSALERAERYRLLNEPVDAEKSAPPTTTKISFAGTPAHAFSNAAPT